MANSSRGKTARQQAMRKAKKLKNKKFISEDQKCKLMTKKRSLLALKKDVEALSQNIIGMKSLNHKFLYSFHTENDYCRVKFRKETFEPLKTKIRKMPNISDELHKQTFVKVEENYINIQPLFRVQCIHCNQNFLSINTLAHQAECVQFQVKFNLPEPTRVKKTATGKTRGRKPRNKLGDDNNIDPLSIKDEPVMGDQDGDLVTEPATANDEDGKSKRVRRNKALKGAKPGPKLKDKAVADLDKMCCVPLGDGNVCMRIITCKAHTVALKKAVFGRSLPYQTLVQRHYANNAKLKAEKLQTTSIIVPNASATSKAYDSDRELDSILDSLTEFKPLPTNESSIAHFTRRILAERCQVYTYSLYNPLPKNELEENNSLSNMNIPGTATSQLAGMSGYSNITGVGSLVAGTRLSSNLQHQSGISNKDSKGVKETKSSIKSKAPRNTNKDEKSKDTKRAKGVRKGRKDPKSEN